MLDARIITCFFVGVFIMNYGISICKVFIKNDDEDAKLKSRTIEVLTIICAVIFILQLPVGTRAKRDSLSEIVMHHHPNSTIIKQYEYDGYGIAYYKEKYSNKIKFAYYINENGWKLGNKYYYDHSHDDFEIEKKDETKEIKITFNVLKKEKKTFVYFTCNKLDGKEIDSDNDLINDSLFTTFEKVETKDEYTYIGVVDQIINMNDYVITFNGKDYKW